MALASMTFDGHGIPASDATENFNNQTIVYFQNFTDCLKMSGIDWKYLEMFVKIFTMAGNVS